MILPDDLQRALDAELSNYSARQIQQAVASISARYRLGSPNAGPFVRSDLDVTAFAAYRLPATFRAAVAALDQVKLGLGQWQPTSVLDLGAGLGSAAWAATVVWSGIKRVTLLERDLRMLSLGSRLTSLASDNALRTAQWKQADMGADDASDPYQLVLASYTVSESAEAERQHIIRRAWKSCTGCLVIIEPGTPSGFEVIRAARSQLIDDGAHVVAPCPHDSRCPMSGGDWCHFAARVQRSSDHRASKAAALGHEDEKFSYVAVSREEPSTTSSRVIRHPQKRTGHTYLRLCTPPGLETRIVSKREGDVFRRAKRIEWGDVWEDI